MAKTPPKQDPDEKLDALAIEVVDFLAARTDQDALVALKAVSLTVCHLLVFGGFDDKFRESFFQNQQHYLKKLDKLVAICQGTSDEMGDPPTRSVH